MLRGSSGKAASLACDIGLYRHASRRYCATKHRQLCRSRNVKREKCDNAGVFTHHVSRFGSEYHMFG